MQPGMNLRLGYVPGCIGRVCELHANFYSRTVGFGAPFEAKVASELSAFCLSYREDRDGLWLAVDRGVIHGSIAIDGSHYEEDGAHLRWFITSDAARGQGWGSQLLDAAMAFCAARHYTRVHLWTFDELHAARRLYEQRGFQLVLARRGTQWGKEVNEQRFELRGSD